MTRRPENAATTRSGAPLPVPVEGAAGVPASVDAHARLEAELKQVAAAVDRRDVPALRRAQRTVPRLRQAFARVDRPATSEEIVVGANGVIRTKPLAGNIDWEAQAELLMAEMARRKVTAFELATAVREHFCAKGKFVDTGLFFEELEKARRAAVQHRRLLAVDPAQHIAQIEDENRKFKREREQAVARTRLALDKMSATARRLCLERGGHGLRGIGYVDAQTLMAAVTDDERDRMFVLAPWFHQRELLRGAPDGWEPPSDERVAEILEEKRDEEDGDGLADHGGEDD